MKKWVRKAVVQKTISYLPANRHINFFFQKYVTRGVHLSDQYFSDKLISAIDHLRFNEKYGKSDSPTVLELGTGWYPVVPIALFLGGAEKTISIDISPLMTREAILTTIRKYCEWYVAGRLQGLRSFVREDRFKELVNLLNSDEEADFFLKKIRMELKVCDARDSGFEDSTFDLILSNNTFEHIPPEILAQIMVEFQRVLKPGGVMSHFIDMSDHFAHFDKTISIYNYLRFSKRQWAAIDNSIQPQNRMRLRDYEEMYERIGIEVMKRQFRQGNVKEVEALPIHADYRSYSPTEIAISHAHLVSGKKITADLATENKEHESRPKHFGLQH